MSLSNRFAWPYRRPDSSPFGPLSQWRIGYGNQPAQVLVTELGGWDAASRCTCTRTLNLDAITLCQKSGLDPLGTTLKIAVVAATANGRMSELVWSRIAPPQYSGSFEVRLDFGSPDARGLLGAGVLASDLTLQTGIYLAEADGNAAPLTAKRPGSILWSDTHRVDLEGPEVMVPMTPISFRRTFMGINAPEADFYIALEAVQDAASPFRTSVMVYANIDTGFDQRLADAEGAAIAEVYDGLVTQLCMHLLLGDMFAESDMTFEPGTVGAVAHDSLAAAFPGKSTDSIAQLLRTRPAHFMVQMRDSTVRATKGFVE